MTDDTRDKKKPKTPDPIDIEVGARIKMQRRVLGISQGTLADSLGVTFQQVQKYEKGTNRVSASRLQNVANIFGVPVSYFFLGLQTDAGSAPSADPDREVMALFETTEGRELNRAFIEIRSPTLRKSFVTLVRAIAEPELKKS
ncbi:helix-turn-helix domain-containing protein [Agrobacterium tumefaciens]|uniref:helix-turn-helix domain-containing protein n=1 Tax=Agrobacterium tumefaciens TaxID=358 RepID=UPI0022430619|nr:helix-turn-helix transcriptional regulator [Agrobacterium tumefaciens]MCW8060546.1 helix-turn-helix transcriptional regulator [Agrobacterium tumefaciens]MCW8145989.1 helix-turn-helix transcriptional regulator [Agrobacterium tumefaciens]